MKKIMTVLLCTFLLGMVSCASGPNQESTGQFFDSAAITTKVKTALVRDKRVSAIDVKVITYKNEVQLSGYVSTYKQREIATEIASGIHGVERIVNNIIVKNK